LFFLIKKKKSLTERATFACTTLSHSYTQGLGGKGLWKGEGKGKKTSGKNEAALLVHFNKDIN